VKHGLNQMTGSEEKGNEGDVQRRDQGWAVSDSITHGLYLYGAQGHGMGGMRGSGRECLSIREWSHTTHAWGAAAACTAAANGQQREKEWARSWQRSAAGCCQERRETSGGHIGTQVPESTFATQGLAHTIFFLHAIIAGVGYSLRYSETALDGWANGGPGAFRLLLRLVCWCWCWCWCWCCFPLKVQQARCCSFHCAEGPLRTGAQWVPAAWLPPCTSCLGGSQSCAALAAHWSPLL